MLVFIVCLQTMEFQTTTVSSSSSEMHTSVNKVPRACQHNMRALLHWAGRWGWEGVAERVGRWGFEGW